MGYYREKLKRNHGYVMYDDIPDYIEEFGEYFLVVIKTYTHGRPLVTLGQLLSLEVDNPDLYEDIREVFIPSNVYKEMFGEVIL